MIENNDLYDKLKVLAQIVLPALGTLYFTLAGIWDLPSAEEVVGTIVAVDAFLGVVLQISSNKFNAGVGQGTLRVLEGTKGKTFSLEIDGDPEKDLEGKHTVVFNVKTDKPSA